jgi:circadian clock protein KaiB
MSGLVLRLYIAGDARNSIAAVRNLHSALADCGAGSVSVEIIDILTDPERGLRDGILVTPMLIKMEPAPERRILGSLLDRPRLLAVLGLDEARRE